MPTFKVGWNDTIGSMEWNKVKHQAFKDFESMTYGHVSDQLKTKLDDKNKRYVFIGFDE